MERKYILTDETIMHDDVELHRIKAVRQFSNVKSGELGGFVQSESNLAHDGICWIYHNAKVLGDAVVYEDGIVANDAVVEHHAKIHGSATVHGDSHIYDGADIFGNAAIGCHCQIFSQATVFDNAIVQGYAQVHGHARIYGKAIIANYANVCDHAQVYGDAHIIDLAEIQGYAQIYGHANVSECATVWSDAKVHGDANVSNSAVICGGAEVMCLADYMVFKNWWSSGRAITWTRSNDRWKVGCFYGTGRELVEKAYLDSQSKGKEYEQIVNYVEEAKKRIAATTIDGIGQDEQATSSVKNSK